MAKSGHEPNIADVAQLAGVSPTTVSRVLNNRGYLSEATKEKVSQAMAELHYRPNEVARALLGQRTRVVGVIVPTVELPFFGEVAVSLEHTLMERGYRTLLCNSLGRAEIERDYLRQLEGHRVDGIITGAHNDTLPEYSNTRLPIVTIDREISSHIPNVRSDNHAGGVAATELLLSRGARAPLLLTSTSGPHNLREAGYRDVVTNAGIAPRVHTVPFGTPEPERTRAIFAIMDSMRDTVDSVFATDDLSACTVIEWARVRSVAIPEDLLVIGFDGTRAIRTATPWLSTISQHIPRIARSAVSVLLDRIDAGTTREVIPPDQLVFPISVVDASTTGGTDGISHQLMKR